MTLILFVVAALSILGSGFMVVKTQDLVHAVLWLALMSLSVAGIYVILDSDFIGAVQVLLYTGGIATLMLFGVMLTTRLEGSRIRVQTKNPVKGALVAATLFGFMAWAILSSPLPTGDLADASAEKVGEAFLTQWVLPFETLSMLLLAVMIGAIVIARRKDPS